METKYTCTYSCKHYFGETNIMARNEKDALIGLKLKIENNHIDTSLKTRSDCGNKCNLKIKIK